MTNWRSPSRPPPLALSRSDFGSVRPWDPFAAPVRSSLGGCNLMSTVRFALCLAVLWVMAVSACDQEPEMDSERRRSDVLPGDAPEPVGVDPDRRLLGGNHLPGRGELAQPVGCPGASGALWRRRGSPPRRPMGSDRVLDQDSGPSCRPTTGDAAGLSRRPPSRRPDLRAGFVLACDPAKRRTRSGGSGASGALRPVSRATVTAWPGGLALADRQPPLSLEVGVAGRGWRSLRIPVRRRIGMPVQSSREYKDGHCSGTGRATAQPRTGRGSRAPRPCRVGR